MPDEHDMKKKLAEQLANRYHLTLLGQNANGFKFGYWEEYSSPDLQELEFFLDSPCSLVALNSKPSFLLSPSQKSTFRHSNQNNDVAINSTELTDSSIISLIDDVISEAIDVHASDIHFETYEKSFRIRFRLDGMLTEQQTVSFSKKAAVISRIKIMAGLDIAEKRRPQDGRITVSDGRRNIDLRVSTLPTHFGEKIVLRVLDKSNVFFDLKKLGFSDQDYNVIKRIITLPFGLVLVTGPTGSGKSTTLYAILQELNSVHHNIVTIEDPIEYDLRGINQAQARPDLGFNFASALRTFLRQDPDIIMVGEIRDRETAEMAIRAALTGHLVFSTLHTNDAPSAVVRLMDMGIDPFLIAASVKLVIAQRLVRQLCGECCKPMHPPFEHCSLTLNERHQLNRTDPLYHENGCPVCRETGYTGRCGLFEVFPVDEETSEHIHKGLGLNEIRNLAEKKGLRSLREQGIKKVSVGITSISEVIRETAI